MPYINNGYIYTGKVLRAGQPQPLAGYTFKANLIGDYNKLALAEWVDATPDLVENTVKAIFTADMLQDVKDGVYMVAIKVTKGEDSTVLTSDTVELTRYQ